MRPIYFDSKASDTEACETMFNGALSLIFIAPISDLEPGYSWLTSTFSPGGFKSVGTKRAEKTNKAEVLPKKGSGSH